MPNPGHVTVCGVRLEPGPEWYWATVDRECRMAVVRHHDGRCDGKAHVPFDGGWIEVHTDRSHAAPEGAADALTRALRELGLEGKVKA